MFIKRLTVGSIATNCYILCDTVTSTAAVIDPGADAPRILQALRDTHCEAQYVILTHGHFDHAGAAVEVLRETGAKLAVYEEEAGLLNDPAHTLRGMFEAHILEDVPVLVPDLLLHDGESFTVGSQELKVLHTPGHTPGSCCLICQDNLFSGDTLFRDSAGRTDFPGGDAAELARSIRRLSELEGDFNVLPGHGELTTLAREREANPFF